MFLCMVDLLDSFYFILIVTMAKQQDQTQVNDKKWIHGSYFENVDVECICESKFVIASTVPWPLKVEICPACHPIYNKDKVIKKSSKGRMEKFLEKQKRMDGIKKAA